MANNTPNRNYNRPSPARPAQARGGYVGGSRQPAGYPGGRNYSAGTQDYGRQVYARNTAMAKKRRRKKRTTYAIMIVLLFVAVVGLLVWALVNVLENAFQGNTISGDQVGHGTVNQDYATLPNEYKDKDIVNFLVCGLGYDGDEEYTDPNNRIGPTDVIMYVRYDLKANSINILQIPRDVFIGDNYKTGGTRKINGLFLNAPDKSNRINALAEVIYEQFKLPIDYYITIDLDSMKEFVEVVHGLNVYIPYDIDKPGTDSLIEAGWRQLSPEQVEYVMRNRYSSNYNQQMDIMRLQTQQNVYAALFRLFRTLTPRELVGWAQVGLRHIKTDVAVAKLPELMMSLLNVKSEDIVFIRPPGGHAMYNGQAVWSLDSAGTAELLNEYFRAEGVSYSASELDIQELPRNVGTVPASIKTMASAEENAPPPPEDYLW